MGMLQIINLKLFNAGEVLCVFSRRQKRPNKKLKEREKERVKDRTSERKPFVGQLTLRNGVLCLEALTKTLTAV